MPSGRLNSTGAASGTRAGDERFLAMGSTEGEMPAKSKAQQKAAGAALAAKRGEQKVSELKGPAKSMYESMSESQLEDFASTKRKGKPEHASKKK
jgi:hypothetical protein